MIDRTYSTTGTNNVTSDYEGYANPLPVYADKMIPDNTVQKERAIINAGGLSPNMAEFLMKDAQNIINKKPAWKPSTIDYNYPEVHYPLDKGKKMTVKELGAAPPLFEHIRRL